MLAAEGHARPHLGRGVAHRAREREREVAGLDRGLVLTLGAEQKREAAEDLRLAAIVAHGLCERLGLVEALARALEVAGRMECPRHAEVHVARPLLNAAISGQPRERSQRVLVAGHRLAPAGLRERQVARLLEEEG